MRALVMWKSLLQHCLPEGRVGGKFLVRGRVSGIALWTTKAYSSNRKNVDDRQERQDVDEQVFWSTC